MAVSVETQRQWVTSQVVEEEQSDFAHGDGDDEEPAQPAHEEETRCEQEVEAEEEDDAADIPLSAAE